MELDNKEIIEINSCVFDLAWNTVTDLRRRFLIMDIACDIILSHDSVDNADLGLHILLRKIINPEHSIKMEQSKAKIIHIAAFNCATANWLSFHNLIQLHHNFSKTQRNMVASP